MKIGSQYPKYRFFDQMFKDLVPTAKSVLKDHAENSFCLVVNEYMVPGLLSDIHTTYLRTRSFANIGENEDYWQDVVALVTALKESDLIYATENFNVEREINNFAQIMFKNGQNDWPDNLRLYEKVEFLMLQFDHYLAGEPSVIADSPIYQPFLLFLGKDDTDYQESKIVFLRDYKGTKQIP